MIGARHAARNLFQRGDPTSFFGVQSSKSLARMGRRGSPGPGPGQEGVVRHSKIGKSRQKCEFFDRDPEWT